MAMMNHEVYVDSHRLQRDRIFIKTGLKKELGELGELGKLDFLGELDFLEKLDKLENPRDSRGSSRASAYQDWRDAA